MKKTFGSALFLTLLCCAADSFAKSDNADAAPASGRISFAGAIATPTCKIYNNQLRLTIDCPGSHHYSQMLILTEKLGTHQTAYGLRTILFKWLNKTRSAGIVTVTFV